MGIWRLFLFSINQKQEEKAVMKAIFEHKPDFRFRNFVVEKTVSIPAERFEEMLRHPMKDQDFLTENKELMRQDGMGVNHCLLVTGKGRLDGLLVESEGYPYVRYAAYVPEVTALQYPSLSKMNRELAAAVDFIIADGTSQTTEGQWILPFDELEERTGLCVEGKPFLQEIMGNMLRERPEVSDLSIEETGFDVVYYLDFCPNCQRASEPETVLGNAARQTLRELIRTPWDDVHLVHKEVEIDPVTIAGLAEDTLTEAGKQAWADVLDAKVCRIYEGAYGLQVELEGVEPSRLQDFSSMLAGYCSDINYEKWVSQREEAEAPSPELKL